LCFDIFFSFFTMLIPPLPTLFPYTTLFRSMLRLYRIDAHALQVEMFADAQRHQGGNALPVGRDFMQFIAAVRLRDGLDPVGAIRSEEHTSELQSRENLVCSLLLEKKK